MSQWVMLPGFKLIVGFFFFDRETSFSCLLFRLWENIYSSLFPQAVPALTGTISSFNTSHTNCRYPSATDFSLHYLNVHIRGSIKNTNDLSIRFHIHQCLLICPLFSPSICLYIEKLTITKTEIKIYKMAKIRFVNGCSCSR